MDINVLLQLLRYLRDAQHWLSLDTSELHLTHHYRLVQKAGEESGEAAKAIGSHVYQTSINNRLTPPRPAVFVAKLQEVA